MVLGSKVVVEAAVVVGGLLWGSENLNDCCGFEGSTSGASVVLL